jgi:hypothetical protein
MLQINCPHGLGNHEFDLDEADLQKRIDESAFNWLASNVSENINGNLTPFYKMVDGIKIPFPKTVVFTFKNAQGKSVKMGIFSVVLPSNKKDYVYYDDFFETAVKTYETLKSTCDFVVAITHLNKADDAKLAGRLLERILETGMKNKGSGGFLQWDKISHNQPKNEWFINGKLLDVNQDYYIAIPKFMMEGKETNLGYLTVQNPDVQSITESDEKDIEDIRNDIRKVLIAYLKGK